MIEEEESPKLPAPAPEHDGELLLYDFFKHLTTLALLALGGVLSLSQVVDRTDVKPWLLVAILVTISIGGIASFSGASEIVRARYTRTAPHKSLNLYRIAAPAFLALGVGMFLSMFIDSLN